MIDSSAFHLFRTLIALVEIDVDRHPRELEWLKNLIAKQNLTPEQRKVLQEDFASPPPFKKMFSHVTRYQDQIRLIEFARHLFQLDQDFHPLEKEAFDRLQEMHDQKFASLLDHQKELAKEIVKDMERKALYQEIDDFIAMMNKRLPLLHRLYPSLAILSGILTGNRIFIGFAVGLVIVAVIIRFIIHVLLEIEI